MNSIVNVKKQIQESPDNWEIPFMDFVDDFRYYKDYSAIARPFKCDNERFDAILASTIEYLCHEQGLDVPQWTKDVSSCKKPWFVSGMENLKAIALVESPLEFRIRKIFVLENFLNRA